MSSGIGKNMRLLSTIFSISIYAKQCCCYLRYLIYILTEINVYGSKSCFYSCYFIVTELKEETVNSNAMYMVKIENLYASRN